jgi:Protein of unknown function (DUF3108)
VAGTLNRPSADTRKRRQVLARIAGLVILLHTLVLAWLASQWHQPAPLQTVPPPIFTRQITRPTAPVQALHARAASQRVSPSDAARPVPATESDRPQPPPAEASPPAPATEPAVTTSASIPDAASPTTPRPADTPVDTRGAGSTTGEWPADTRLSYRLGGHFRGELHGDARVQWQHEAGHYQTRVEIDIGWLIRASLTSQGLVGPANLHPLIYEEQVRGVRRRVVLDERGITLQGGARVARPDAVQDTASQFVELAHRFATGQASLEVGHPVTVWLARPGGVDLWTYDVTERVTLATPALGPVDAFHLKPRPLAQPRGPITAEIWFAPGLQYLPVRIRIQLTGDSFIDLLVDKIEQR